MADARGLLRRLVAFPTVAGTSNVALVDWVAGVLEDAGAAVRILPGPRPDGHGLHAVLGPPDGRGVLLSAHSDVVTVEGQAWSRDPWTLHEEDGRLVGRGAADMKGFLAAVLAAAPQVARRRLRRPLHLVLSCDEELGCRGTPALLAGLAGLIAPPAWCVVGEPTRMRVVERHKGKLALRIDLTGRAAHSSRPGDGVNAVEHAARLVVDLLGLGDELRAGPADPAFAVPFSTVSTGPIRGGVTLNTVPDRCRVDVEIRLVPGQDPEELHRRVDALLERADGRLRREAPEAALHAVVLAEYPALAPGHDGDGGAAAQVARLAGAGAGGAVDFGTEAGLLQRGLGVPVVVCGPGDMAQGHRPDEYLDPEQLEQAERFVLSIGDTLEHA